MPASEDRFVLARLYETIGDWPKAREKYRELDLRTENLARLETLNRRPSYLAQFADSLLRHRSADDQEDLSEAQGLADEIKQLQPGGCLGSLAVRCRSIGLVNDLDRQRKLIAEHLPPARILYHRFWSRWRTWQRQVKQFRLAEELYRLQENQAGTMQNKLLLAAFLGRHDRVKDGLDICEPLCEPVGSAFEDGGVAVTVLKSSLVPTTIASIRTSTDRPGCWLD